MILENSSLLQERFNSHVFMCDCLKMQRALGEFVSPKGEVYFPCIYACLSKSALGKFVSPVGEVYFPCVYVCLPKMQRALGEFVSPKGEL